jgi:hypothetical protein
MKQKDNTVETQNFINLFLTITRNQNLTELSEIG